MAEKRAELKVFRHVVVKTLGKQGALRAIFTFNKTSHRQLSSARWDKSIDSESFHTAWTRSGHCRRIELRCGLAK